MTVPDESKILNVSFLQASFATEVPRNWRPWNLPSSRPYHSHYCTSFPLFYSTSSEQISAFSVLVQWSCGIANIHFWLQELVACNSNLNIVFPCLENSLAITSGCPNSSPWMEWRESDERCSIELIIRLCVHVMELYVLHIMRHHLQQKKATLCAVKWRQVRSRCMRPWRKLCS